MKLSISLSGFNGWKLGMFEPRLLSGEVLAEPVLVSEERLGAEVPGMEGALVMEGVKAEPGGAMPGVALGIEATFA